MILKRNQVNFFSFLFAISIIFISLKVSESGLGSDRDDFPHIINYTDLPEFDFSKLNQYEWSAAGFDGIYKMTTSCINSLWSKNWDPEDFLSLKENHGVEFRKDAVSNLKKFAGIITLMSFICICFVSFILCGIGFCCCRCCGKCGATQEKYIKGDDFTSKIILVTILLIGIVFLTFCVVCAFGTNEQLNTGVNELTEGLHKTVNDSAIYIEQVEKELNSVLDTNFNEFNTGMNDILTETGDSIVKEILDVPGNPTLVNLRETMDNLDKTIQITKDLNIEIIEAYIYQLIDVSQHIKIQIFDVLPDCSNVQGCGELENFKFSFDFALFYGNKHIIDNILNHEMNIEKIKNQINKNLNNILSDVKGNVTALIEDAKKSFNEAGEQVNKSKTNILETTNDFKEAVLENVDSALNDADEYLNYYRIAYIIGVIICCLLLFLLLGMTFGLIFGICGTQPRLKNIRCCTKSYGSNALICSVISMFLLGVLLSLLAFFFLAFGILGQRIVCDPLKDPNSPVLKYFTVDLSVNVNLDTILRNCSENKAVYEVFDLSQKFDLDKIIHDLDIKEAIEKLDINIDPDLFNFITDSQTGELNFLDSQRHELDIFTDTMQHIKENKFSTAFDELKHLLNDISKILSNNQPIKDILKDLEFYEENLLNPLIQEIITLKENITNLKECVNNVPPQFGTDVFDAQEQLKNDFTDKQNEVITTVKNNIMAELNFFLDDLQSKATNEIGKCKPLYHAFQGIHVTVCDKIIQPLSGLGFTFFLVITNFLVLIIVCAWLAAIYQKFKEDPRPDFYSQENLLNIQNPYAYNNDGDFVRKTRF